MYYGDFAEDDTVNIVFNTFTSDDPSASCTITNLVAGDIKIHKDGHVDEKASSDGITVVIDFDGITGNHLVTIDTSDDTGAAGFWVTGSEYQVRMEGTTVDGATINAWVGSFSIERAGGVLARLETLITTVGAAGVGLTEAGGDGDHLTEAGGDGDHLVEAGGDGDHLTAINLPNQTMDITGSLSGAVGSCAAATVSAIGNNVITAASIADAAIDNATFAADVGSTAHGTNIIALAVRKILEELNLDHLLKVAVADRDTLAEVVDDTVLANLMTKTDGDTSDFDHATDSLEAIRDRGDAAWTTAGASLTLAQFLALKGLEMLLQYKLSDYDVTGDPMYVGSVDSEGRWYIKEINTTNETVRYISGIENYSTNWTNRTALTYGRFQDVF